MELTIDELYDRMRRHVINNQERPNYLLIHPNDSIKIKILFIENFGYYQHSIGDNKLHFQGVDFIRSYDVPEGNPIFVK